MTGASGGWSTSYRWMGVTRADAKGLVQHDLRAPEVTQSNPQVDSSRSLLNVAHIADGRGGLRPLSPGEDGATAVTAILDDIIAGSKKNVRRTKVKAKDPETGKRVPTGEVREVEVSLRADAAVMVECLMQLDPEFTGTGRAYDEGGRPVWVTDDNGEEVRDANGRRIQLVRTCADMTPQKREEVDRLLDVMIEEVIAQHPDGDVLYVAKHLDETAPHVQMAWVPKTGDGRINYKEVMSDAARTRGAAKAAYAAKHDRMRERLLEHGYEATMERVDGGKHHLGLRAFKRWKDREARIDQDDQKLNDWDRQLRDAKADVRVERELLEASESELASRHQSVLDQEAELPRLRRKAIDDGRAEGLADAEAVITAQVQQKVAAVIAPAQEQVAKLLQEAEDERQRAIADANRYFADAKSSALRHRAEMIESAKTNLPDLFEEFLDTPTRSGVTPRRTFDRFVDKRIGEFEAEHGVTGRLVMEPGDREAFTADGGERLAAEIAELQRDRQHGD
ncbi:hypothetical protein [Solicola gregarius]|uniref:Mobilization protein n=1 Tax=Solicola gregarius TaxID=2908642 RepID=A0AA46TIT1_9ACTN|nr:hypothetical protein [Solicola gregarius]UYM06076.1 hypothetical protein L0C25_03105 [Solicola gregarius]